jgi:predicted transcriptional regulator
MSIDDIRVVERMLVAGQSRKQIAEEFGTTPGTVKQFIKTYMKEWVGYNSPVNRKDRREKRDERIKDMRGRL